MLAHQRFVADRASFAGLSLRERFQRIHDTNLWGAAESVSGLGSEIDATAVLRAELPALLRRLGVRTLLDAPCGDGGWIASADLGVRVTGVDVVPDLIAALQRRGDVDRDYLLADITCDPLPAADAILCRDCLVHFSFANIARAVENFRRSGATWLITTTFPEWQTNHRLRGRRLACAQFRAGAVCVGRACRTAQRELHGGRRRLARQESGRVASR